MEDPVALNWLKDIGVAAATLLVFGRVMYLLVEALVVFFRGVREDNRERNVQFGMLLNTNQAIASQMELTHQAIEQGMQAGERHTEAMRASTAELAAMRHDMDKGFSVARNYLVEHLQPFDVALDEMVDEVANLVTHITQEFQKDGQLQSTTQQSISGLSTQLDAYQVSVIAAIVETLQPALDKLDKLEVQLTETRTAVVSAVEQVIEEKLLGMARAEQPMENRPSPSEN